MGSQSKHCEGQKVPQGRNPRKIQTDEKVTKRWLWSCDFLGLLESQEDKHQGIKNTKRKGSTGGNPWECMNAFTFEKPLKVLEMIGSCQTRLFQTWLCLILKRKCSFALFCTLAFALFCAYFWKATRQHQKSHGYQNYSFFECAFRPLCSHTFFPLFFPPLPCSLGKLTFSLVFQRFCGFHKERKILG